MSESLNVVALISGGKDSFFSILHCIQNGHKVVALGNLRPADPEQKDVSEAGENAGGDEHDLNSFMFQTVGHTVIPLYEQALGIPLYRQQIHGTAVQTGTSYSHADVPSSGVSMLEHGIETKDHGDTQDETESLIPLLKRIMAEHPTVNALSTGAILSTYQRTRIESVALRLGLTPLSYLWKYPILPPGIQSSLLQDMQSVGLDARIVKVASGGLDESFLWENIASDSTVRRVERSMKRFGTDGDGGVLGEGGEFETLVVDGPASLFKGRIEVKEEERRIVREGGGSAWLQFRSATVAMKSPVEAMQNHCRAPDLLEESFKGILQQLTEDKRPVDLTDMTGSLRTSRSPFYEKAVTTLKDPRNEKEYWTVSADPREDRSITLEAQEIVTRIRHCLQASKLEANDIISTIILLRNMSDFASINKVYGALFTEPNPPSRVTVSCGDLLPPGINLTIHLKVHKQAVSSPPKKCLHVQSRSYWAPANIGPYSQAISVPVSKTSNDQDHEPPIWTMNVAGQIPLIPHTMVLPSPKASEDPHENFKIQTVLSLQHLWRIGHEMNISWYTSTVAYLPHGHNNTSLISQQANIASQAWTLLHCAPRSSASSEASEERDLWEEKYYFSKQTMGRSSRETEKSLPNWSLVQTEDRDPPPFFAAEVEELPRQAAIEWQAHLGLIDGPISIRKSRSVNHSWRLHQTIVHNTIIQSLVMIYPPSEAEGGLDLEGILREALGGVVAERLRSHASYVDVASCGAASAEARTLGLGLGLDMLGMVPCRSLWDDNGRRLAAVVFL